MSTTDSSSNSFRGNLIHGLVFRFFCLLRLAVSHADIIAFDYCIRISSDILCDCARSSRSLIWTQAQIVSEFRRCPLLGARGLSPPYTISRHIFNMRPRRKAKSPPFTLNRSTPGCLGSTTNRSPFLFLNLTQIASIDMNNSVCRFIGI